MAEFNTSICTVCGDIASYGDGASWALCSKHEREKNSQIVEAQPDEPMEGEGMPHKLVEGLTSIIIPVYSANYAAFHYLGHAIGSIRSSTKLPYELIIVDNGSPIKPGKLADYHAEKIVELKENTGYVKAVNKGIRCSFGEYIAVLTSDIQVYDNWLEDAQEALKHVDLVYGKPMYGEPFSRGYEAGIKRSKWADKPIEASLNNDLEDGACLITTKKLLDEVGLLDEDFFNYCADRDLFERIKRAGKKYAGCERINIFHVIEGTGNFVPETPEIMNKDKEVYKKKWEGVSVEHQPPKIMDDNKKFIRTDVTGDKVYKVHNGKLHWITNPAVLQALGCGFGDVNGISETEYRQYERGEPISMDNVEKFKDANISNSANLHGESVQAGQSTESNQEHREPDL